MSLLKRKMPEYLPESIRRFMLIDVRGEHKEWTESIRQANKNYWKELQKFPETKCAHKSYEQCHCSMDWQKFDKMEKKYPSLQPLRRDMKQGAHLAEIIEVLQNLVDVCFI